MGTEINPKIWNIPTLENLLEAWGKEVSSCFGFTWPSFLLRGDSEARHLDDGGAAASPDRQRWTRVALCVWGFWYWQALPQTEDRTTRMNQSDSIYAENILKETDSHLWRSHQPGPISGLESTQTVHAVSSFLAKAALGGRRSPLLLMQRQTFHTAVNL